MHMPQSLPAIATLAIILWYMVTVFQVGRARTKYKIYAPATTGDPGFERYLRVQMNEVENMVAFLPSMWLYAIMGNPRVAAILGAVYLARAHRVRDRLLGRGAPACARVLRRDHGARAGVGIGVGGSVRARRIRLKPRKFH